MESNMMATYQTMQVGVSEEEEENKKVQSSCTNPKERNRLPGYTRTDQARRIKRKNGTSEEGKRKRMKGQKKKKATNGDENRDEA